MKVVVVISSNKSNSLQFFNVISSLLCFCTRTNHYSTKVFTGKIFIIFEKIYPQDVRLVSKIAGVNETLDLEFGKLLFRVLYQTGMVVVVSSNSKNGEEDHYVNHWGSGQMSPLKLKDLILRNDFYHQMSKYK